MAVLDGKRNPDGILTPVGTTIVNGTPSPNSVNVGRGYALMEIAIAVAGGSPAGQFFLQKKPEASAPSGVRLPSDLGVWQNVADANVPANGLSLGVATVTAATVRVVNPRGEYQMFPGGAAPSGTWGCSYSLVAELR